MKITDLQVEETAAKIASGELSLRAAARDLGVHHSTLSSRIAGLDSRGGEPGTAVVDDSELPIIVRDYTDSPYIYVYPMGDFHLGAAKHRAARVREWLEYLEREERATMLNTGDNINAAIIGAKSDVYAERMTPQDAMEKFEDDLRPLAEAGRLDALTDGNHEMRIYRATGIYPMRALARNLGVPHVSAAAMLVYRVGDVEYEVYMRHGTGSGQSLSQLAKSGNVARADVYVTAHTHQQVVLRNSRFVREGEQMVRHRQTFVSSGSFIGYEEYAAERGYVPSDLGAPRIRLDGRRKDVHVSL